jgi:hypothetical protein
MKRDYFYTSPSGRRLFQLDLGKLTLALIGAPSHMLLDELASLYEPGAFLCRDILSVLMVDYGRLLEKDYPVDPKPFPRAQPVTYGSAFYQITEEAGDALLSEFVAEDTALDSSKFLDAVASLPDRKRNDGSGRAASAVAQLYKVSLTMVYQAKKVLKYGSQEDIDALRRGEVPVKTVYKRLLKHRVPKPEQTAV